MQLVKNQSSASTEESILLSGINRFGKDAYVDCADIINEGNFESLLNKFIYNSFTEIFNNNEVCNITTVFSKCLNAGVPHEDYEKIKAVLSTDCESLHIIRPLAEKFRKKALIKESINIHKSCINELIELNGLESLAKIFSVSESAVFDLIKKYNDSGNENPAMLGDRAEFLLEYWAENPSQNVGIPTPWDKFNASIGGGLRTGVHLIGARSGVGKTIVGLAEALFATENDIPTLFLDTEMEDKDVIPRMLASLSETKIKDIETGFFAQDDFKKNQVNTALEKFKQLRLYHKSVAGMPFDQIMSIIRRWIYKEVGIKEDGGANDCVVIYDYFKLMDTNDMKDMAEFQAMGFQISKMTDFSKKYDFPCLSFVQLNRDGIDKESTASIAQSDRLLWACNSFSIFKDKTLEEMDRDGYKNGNKKIITLKSRYGGEHSFGQYISMHMKKDMSIITEVDFDPNDKENKDVEL